MEITQEDLEARDQRLIQAINRLTENAKEKWQASKEADRELRQALRAVRDGRFYDLVGVISKEDVESLCEISPMPENILNEVK